MIETCEASWPDLWQAPGGTATLTEPVTIVHIRGELDRTTVGELAAVAARLRGSGNTPMALDLSGVTFMDGGGLALILDLADSCREREWVGLLSPRAVIRRLFDMVGMKNHDALRVFETTDQMCIVAATYSFGC